MKMDFRSSVRHSALVSASVLFGLALAGCGGGGGGSNSVTDTTVSTVAGSAEAGTTDGEGSVARFNNPVNVAGDNVGNVYVCDFDGNRIRRISTAGVVSTLTVQNNFQRPFGITFTPDGRLFVTTDANDSGARDTTTGTLWQIDVSSGAATVVARNLGRPRGIAAMSDTQIVMTDIAQNDVRIINPTTRVITPLAGPTGPRGASGFVNGTGSAARFNSPYGVTVTSTGDIMVADQGNNAIRLITPAGVVSTFAGASGVAGFRNGARNQAQFTAPQDVDIDTRGVIYVSDTGNHRIRRISSGFVTNFAGDGVAGFNDGKGQDARFFGQEGLAVNRSGSLIYVADGTGGTAGASFNRVRRLIGR
jgi:sugar lactone lactonase YvrE